MWLGVVRRRGREREIERGEREGERERDGVRTGQSALGMGVYWWKPLGSTVSKDHHLSVCVLHPGVRVELVCISRGNQSPPT
jgi:hypothetical protein